MLRNAGLLLKDQDDDKWRRRSRSTGGRRRSTRTRRSSSSGKKKDTVLLAAQKSTCVFAFAQSKEIEIEFTSENTEQTLNCLDFLEALCRLACAVSSSQDRRPMVLKLNDIWQRHIRALLSLDTVSVYDRLITVMQNYVPKMENVHQQQEEQEATALTKESEIRNVRAKIESRLATSKEWRACTRAISSNEIYYGTLIRSVL